MTPTAGPGRSTRSPLQSGPHASWSTFGSGIDRTKHPLGRVEGSTENATLVTDLIVDLRERGLDVTKPVLAVIDGSKALRRALLDVFEHAVIHCCQLQKVRNVESRLPDGLASTVASKMRAAYRNPAPSPPTSSRAREQLLDVAVGQPKRTYQRTATTITAAGNRTRRRTTPTGFDPYVAFATPGNHVERRLPAQRNRSQQRR